MDELREAWRRMVPWLQAVHSTYSLDDSGHLVAAGAVVTAYAPINRPEVPGELAKVRSEADALAFAKRYGLLGFPDADRTPPLGFAEVASPKLPSNLRRARGWRAFLEQRRQHDQAPGDPIDWFLAHAATVRTIAELGFFSDDKAQLIRYLDQYRVRRSSEEVIALRAARGGERRPDLIEFPVNVGAPALARRIAAGLLNDNLARARRHMNAETLQSQFGLRTLLDVVYWLLADALTGQQLRQCLACGGIFTATSDRMKYCPPPMGLDGPSRCMNRAKVRKWRKEKRLKETSRKRRRSGRRPGRTPR